jgi:hypothetical protein
LRTDTDYRDREVLVVDEVTDNFEIRESRVMPCMPPEILGRNSSRQCAELYPDQPLCMIGFNAADHVAARSNIFSFYFSTIASSRMP